MKSGASFPACVLIWIASQRLAPLFFIGEFFALGEIEFAGSENGDCVNTANFFRDP
jgi:hypothetical protein